MRLTVICIVLLAVLGACEKEVSIPVEYTQPKLVANCLLTDGEPFAVEVSRSQYIFDTTDLALLTGASVTLTDGNGNTQFNVSTDGGYAYSPEIIRGGQEYSFSISYPDLETVTASVHVPKQTPIGTLSYGGIIRSDDTDYQKIHLSFTDGVGSDFYTLSIYQKVWSGNLNKKGRYPNMECSEDGWDCEPIVPDGWYFDEDTWLIFPYGEEPYGDEEYYKSPIYISVAGIDAEGGMNDEVLEYFFADTYFDGNTVQLDVLVNPGDVWGENSDSIYVELSHISESYYRYCVSRDLYLDSDGIMTQPVQVYTNIDGGFGVLGAKSVAWKGLPMIIPTEEYFW